MFVSVDTDSRGATCLLLGLTLANISDCLARPELGDELIARFSSPTGARYRRETPDEWSTVAAEVWRENQRALPRRRLSLAELIQDHVCSSASAGTSPSDVPWAMDCEEFASMGATYATLVLLRYPELRARIEPIEVGIIQPKDHGMAHAVTRIGGRWVDFSCKYGMRQPRDLADGSSWYDQAEAAVLEVHPPQFSIWRPRASASAPEDQWKKEGALWAR